MKIRRNYLIIVPVLGGRTAYLFRRECTAARMLLEFQAVEGYKVNFKEAVKAVRKLTDLGFNIVKG